MLNRILALTFALICGMAVLAKPVIQLSTDPGSSPNGESVLFKIKIVNDGPGEITPPQMPLLTDWELKNSFESSSRSVNIINGTVKYTISTEYSFILQPLRVGVLKIPSLILGIGKDNYRTAEVTVQVDRLPGGMQQRPRGQARPAPNNPGFSTPLPNNVFPQDNYHDDIQVPDRESFFVRGEVSKSTVYQGELITLAYALYQRRLLSLSEPGISKFPDFKGFLKEELDIKRDFTPVPYDVKGETFYRAELIKFAVFPIKSGRLRIEPLKFRATLLPNQADLLNSIMSGNIPQTDGIPTEKFAQEIVIDAKPLPPLPANAPFTGAVGQFQIEFKGPPPTAKLQVDQPFSLSFTIAGKGNVKAIEEPRLPLPKILELNTTRTNYEFRPDATGYKTFDYLILPRAEGKLRIEPFEYLYFDPAKGKYESLNTPAIELNIEGASTVGSAPVDSTLALAQKSLSPWRVGTQNFSNWKNISSSGPLASLAVWAGQAALYALLAFVFWRQRADAKKTDYYRQMPWEKTAEIIKSKTEWDNKELALLVDQWTRERLTGALAMGNLQFNLHSESPRDEFLEALRQTLHPEFHKALDPLRLYWSDLDIVRFSGLRSSQEKTLRLFEQGQKHIQSILAGLKQSLKTIQEDV